jgi:ParB family transcriptional regulator, chromosome partitioning protein
MDLITPIPLDQIRDDALIRDRAGLDPEALEELINSLVTEGLRQPIEVWEFPEPMEGLRYGLISGLRRLTATRELARRRQTAAPTIAAFIRMPASIPAAMAAMVSENEMRTQITPWEKGLLLADSVYKGMFTNLDNAYDALYPNLSRQKRARLRNLAQVVEAFDGHFTTPDRLTATQMERLAAALRGGLADVLREVLGQNRSRSLPSQWAAITPTLAEAFSGEETDATPTTPARPKRLLHLKQGLTIRREQCQNGWILRFTGPEAKKGGLMDDVFDLVEEMLQPR